MSGDVMKETTLLAIKRVLRTAGLLDLGEEVARTVTPAGRRFREHREQLIRLYSQFIRPGDLCFDVGANLGSRVEVFLRLGAKVVAVEPQDNCVEYLRARYYRQPKVILVHKGLDEVEGERDLFVSSNDSRTSSMSTDWISAARSQTGVDRSHQWDARQVVPVTTLDHLIACYGKPTFCKIDVEGFEYPILKGLSQPLKALSFEYQPALIGAAVDCVSYLATLGNYEFNCSAGETLEMALPDWVDAQDMSEALNTLSTEWSGGDVYARLI
jgi:FkbM family methyltransferase